MAPSHVLRFRSATALALVAGLWLSSCTEPSGPPNIILIFADDMGYGDLGAYGSPTIRTPHLDALAAEGIKLTSFYVTTAACSPSRAGLLTGRYPIRNGVTQVLGPESPIGLDPAEITLAEALRAQGYRTAAIGKWHLGTVEGTLPTDQGFDTYFGILYSHDMMPPWVQTDRPMQFYRDKEPVLDESATAERLTERYTEEALRVIAEDDGRPLFLYLAHNLPHLPVAASEAFRGTSSGGSYGDVIETIDWSLGQILEALERNGLRDHTIVLFTSDNGPWTNMPPRMYETEGVERWHAGSTAGLRGSKATTWEGGVRVPGIAVWPGHIPAGLVSAEPATTMDLFTTLVEVAGGVVPEDRPIDGRNIRSLLEGREAPASRPFFYVYGEQLEAVREGDWKLRIESASADPPRAELFNLADDPFEKFDRSDERPDEVVRLWGLMEAFADETGAALTRPSGAGFDAATTP